MEKTTQIGKWLRDWRFRLFYYLITTRGVLLEELGGTCSWNINSRLLSKGSRVLCAGAGNDISFESELARRGCEVVLLDPSPTGLNTWKRGPVEGVRFLEAALAEKDGVLNLAAPLDEAEGSFRTAPDEMNGPILAVPSRGVTSLMQEFSWKDIDLLKMDIEGGEYPVLSSILDERVSVRQLCVEFHHGKEFSTTRKHTIDILKRLRSVGYKLVHRIHWDHTFVHRSAL